MKSPLSTTMKVTYYAYFVTVPVLLVFGFRYLFSSQFMPYHSAAIGLPWEQVQPGVQFVILALMRVVGGSFIALAIALLMILNIPFRNGYRWAHYTVPVMGIFCAGASLYATLFIKIKTNANTPWLAAGIPVIIYVIGLIMTYQDGKKKLAVIRQSLLKITMQKIIFYR